MVSFKKKNYSIGDGAGLHCIQGNINLVLKAKFVIKVHKKLSFKFFDFFVILDREHDYSERAIGGISGF